MSRLPASPELREVNRDRIAFDYRAADRGEIRCRFNFVIRCRFIFSRITPARKFRILAHTNPSASEGSEALPSLARRVRMSFFGARVIIRCRFIFSGKNDELTPDFFTGFLHDVGSSFRARMMN